MSYQDFVDGITEIAAKSGENVSIMFDIETEDNAQECVKYTGIASNGVRFIGNSSSIKVTAQWGTDHEAQFTLQGIC